MEYESFLRLVKKRRNTRFFKPDPIPEGSVDKIIEAGHWAMSGSNAQPWEFIVIKDAKVKEKLLKIFHDYELASHTLEKSRNAEFIHPGRAKIPTAPRFKDAPEIIVVCADSRTMLASVVTATLFVEDHTFHMNIGNAVQLMHLAATSLGLASEWVSVGNIIEERVKAALGVPPVYRIYMMVPVGYPAVKPREGKRRDIKDIIHNNRFSKGKYRTEDDILDFVKGLRKGYKFR